MSTEISQILSNLWNREISADEALDTLETGHHVEPMTQEADELLAQILSDTWNREISADEALEMLYHHSLVATVEYVVFSA